MTAPDGTVYFVDWLHWIYIPKVGFSVEFFFFFNPDSELETDRWTSGWIELGWVGLLN